MKKYLAAFVAALFLAGCGSVSMYERPHHRSHHAHYGPQQLSPSRIMVLSGDQEVPPNGSGARGHSSIVIYADGSVTGSVRVAGMYPTVAHIHVGAISMNGPPIVPLVRVSDDTFAVPAGTRLNRYQIEAARDGHIYVNVHSDMYPDGEIRAQLLRVL